MQRGQLRGHADGHFQEAKRLLLFVHLFSKILEVLRLHPERFVAEGSWFGAGKSQGGGALRAAQRQLCN